MKKIGLLGMFLVLILSACRKDIDDVKVIEEKPDPIILENYKPEVKNVQTSLIGFVVDENGDPVIDAKVILNEETVTTDDFGHFFFKDKTMNSLGALVQVKRGGYFSGSRRFFPIEGNENRVKIQLLKKQFNQEFDAQTDATLLFNNGTSIEFEANSIRIEDGEAYNGTVQVASQWLDPSALTTLDQMPGNLQGVNTSNEEVALATYGMMAVELQSPTGQALNIAEGFTATLRMPIPASMLNNAPQTIPLWSYHEGFGVWAEEGTATLQGDAYVGKVSHFSFWNCDVPMDYINLDLSLEDNNGTPLANMLVTLERSDASTGSGYTDDNGAVSGKVPANEELMLNVWDVCGDEIYTQVVGPFSTDTSLGAITISGAGVNNTEVSGKLLDCDGNPLNDGIVVVSFGGTRSYYYLNSAEFQISVTTCASVSEVEVVGINLTDLVESVPATAPANTSTDLGDLSVCGQQLQNYVSITVDGVTAIYPAASITASPAEGTIIESYSNQTNDKLAMGFFGITTGNYDGANGNYIRTIVHADNKWNLSDVNQGGLSSFEVTQYDTLVKGTFSGTLINQSGGASTTVTVSGEFNINL